MLGSTMPRLTPCSITRDLISFLLPPATVLNTSEWLIAGSDSSSTVPDMITVRGVVTAVFRERKSENLRRIVFTEQLITTQVVRDCNAWLTVLTGIVVVELLPAQGVVMMAANGEMLGIILVTGNNHAN